MVNVGIVAESEVLETGMKPEYAPIVSNGLEARYLVVQWRREPVK
jgi:hypothetical protein